jgi:autotransporter translocation and assembly factor TamB
MTAVVGLGLTALLSTASGLRLAWGIVGPLLPSSITVEAVSGRLAGPVEMEGFSYTSDRLRIAVRRATIDWDLGSLWSRIVDVRAIDAHDVELELLDHAPPARPGASSGPAPYSLPVEVRVGEATVRSISLGGLPGGFPETVDSLELLEGAYRSEASIGALRVYGPDGSLRVSGRLRTDGRYPFDVEVSGTLLPPEPYAEVELEAEASGDLDAMRAMVGVHRPLEIVASAAVRDVLGARTICEPSHRTLRKVGPAPRSKPRAASIPCGSPGPAASPLRRRAPSTWSWS